MLSQGEKKAYHVRDNSDDAESNSNNIDLSTQYVILFLLFISNCVVLLLISNGFQRIDSTVVVVNDDPLQVTDKSDLFSFFQEYAVTCMHAQSVATRQ